MTAKKALLEEIVKRLVQMDRLLEALDQAEDEDDKDTERAIAFLNRARESLKAAENFLNNGTYSEAAYLFAQGCWNLGCAHGIARRL